MRSHCLERSVASEIDTIGPQQNTSEELHSEEYPVQNKK